MLKIKDNVDLKELAKKYGLVENIAGTDYMNNEKDDDGKPVQVHIGINKATRIVEVLIWGSYWRKDIDLLYDLIKADLVEKEVK